MCGVMPQLQPWNLADWRTCFAYRKSPKTKKTVKRWTIFRGRLYMYKNNLCIFFGPLSNSMCCLPSLPLPNSMKISWLNAVFAEQSPNRWSVKVEVIAMAIPPYDFIPVLGRNGINFFFRFFSDHWGTQPCGSENDVGKNLGSYVAPNSCRGWIENWEGPVMAKVTLGRMLWTLSGFWWIFGWLVEL